MRLPTNRLAISDCGSEKTWMTEPVSTTLPKSMTATLLQIFWMTFISCGDNHNCNMRRVSLIFFSKSRMESVVFGSRALVASSQRRIDGLFASALAIDALFLSAGELARIVGLLIGKFDELQQLIHTRFDVFFGGAV